MTDDDLTPSEARLRSALRQVAEASPVVADLDRLRDDAACDDLVLVDERARSPWGRRLLATAAAVVVLVAGALVLGGQEGDDREDIVADDPVVPTGFYLPLAPDGRWELTEAMAYPSNTPPGDVRWAFFTSADRTTLRGITATVSTVMPPAPDLPSTPEREEVERGTGSDRRTYEVLTARGGEVTTYIRSEARGGDLILSLSGIDVEREALLAMVDRWWESDGSILSPDPSLGLIRSRDDLQPQEDDQPSTAATVMLRVRGADGQVVVRMTLAPWRSVPHPAGLSEDGGEAVGLAEDERPQRLDVPDFDGRAWGWEGNPVVAPRVVVEQGGVLIDLTAFDRPGSPRPATLDELLDLLSVLEPVSATRWADAIRGHEGGSDVIAPDLASVTVPGGPGPEATTPSTPSSPGG